MARRHPKKSSSGSFLALPHRLINSPEYLALSRNARALLIDIGAQYTGSNNGDLSAEWSKMRVRGWPSKTTLHKFRKELQDSGFIVVTRRYGRLTKLPTCYAITWKSIDETNNTKEIRPTKVPPNLWKKRLSSAQNLLLKSNSVPEYVPMKLVK